MAALLFLAHSSGAQPAAYTEVQESDKPLPKGSFVVFNPRIIPGRKDVAPLSFSAQFSYSERDWDLRPQAPKPGRVPQEPDHFQSFVLINRTVPAAVLVMLEHVETAADADPVTLAKILRYNREASAKFRVINETTRSMGGVEGAQTEYVQLRHKDLMRIRHWTAQYNGLACQIELMVPYDHPELLNLGGSQGLPVLLKFSEAQRNRPLLKDAEIPRTFDSPYGYHVNLGEGEWLPDAQDSIIPEAEYVAYTRNQGGIAVMPMSTLGQQVDSDALLNTAIWLCDLPGETAPGKMAPLAGSHLEGVTFSQMFADDEEEMIRMRVKAVCSSNHAYVVVAWINTNAPLGPEVLDQWLEKVTFAENANPWPANAQELRGMKEKNRHAAGLYRLGQHYWAEGDFDRSVAILRTALDCRFLEPILYLYVRAEVKRGHPEEVVQYLTNRGSVTLTKGWVLMNLAFAESRCGDDGKAAVYYAKSLASGGSGVGDFPMDYFENYIRCLIKANRGVWARNRLKERIAMDASPLWPKMLQDLDKTLPAAATTAAAHPAPAAPPAPAGPPELKSIMWNPGKPSAQLDKELLFEGDAVRGYHVVKIQQDAVELKTPEGAPLTLHLKQ